MVLQREHLLRFTRDIKNSSGTVVINTSSTTGLSFNHTDFTGEVLFSEGFYIQDGHESHGGIIRIWNNNNSKYIQLQSIQVVIQHLKQGHLV